MIVICFFLRNPSKPLRMSVHPSVPADRNTDINGLTAKIGVTGLPLDACPCGTNVAPCSERPEILYDDRSFKRIALR